MKNKRIINKGFTLIEPLVVIAIVGLLSTIVIASLNSAREKACDARRIADIKEIQKALDMYYDDYGRCPNPGSSNCSGWDVGNGAHSLFENGVLDPYMSKTPKDPSNYTDCGKGYYYRYPAGSNGCDPDKGAFYVLAIQDMEISGRPHPKSPGFKCSGLDWETWFDCVVGKYEGF